MERLQRTAHIVIWVNPFAGEPEYEPLAEGMSNALPYVDFLPGHNLESLDRWPGCLSPFPRVEVLGGERSR